MAKPGHSSLSPHKIFIKYPPLIDTAKYTCPPLREAKVPQAAINVKWIYVVLDGWGHESTRTQLRAWSIEHGEKQKRNEFKAENVLFITASLKGRCKAEGSRSVPANWDLRRKREI